MSEPLRILAFAGSTRRQSFNKTLVAIAAQGASSAGAEVTLLDLADYPLPLFDQDLEQEQGLPAQGEALRQLVLAHHGILLASPEYNGSLTAVLKNAIDWVSRPHRDGQAPFADKVAAIMSASPGQLGGLRGLNHARNVLTNLGVWVLPQQIAIPAAHQAFTASGELQDERRQSQVQELGAKTVQTVRKLGL
ncbi:MAG: NAD(P)H-dependent oxidoreductase [Chromatiales bacterium]|nr:NAD(P)H-dependent oxidoreductase [Chromatiales bacterium]